MTRSFGFQGNENVSQKMSIEFGNMLVYFSIMYIFLEWNYSKLEISPCSKCIIRC